MLEMLARVVPRIVQEGSGESASERSSRLSLIDIHRLAIVSRVLPTHKGTGVGWRPRCSIGCDMRICERDSDE